MRWWLVLAVLFPGIALAQTTENASKLNGYVVLAPGPAGAGLVSRTQTYVVLDSTPAFIGVPKLNTYVVITTPVPIPAGGFRMLMP